MRPFKNKGFKHYDKITIILGDSTTRGEGAFYPGIAEPVVKDEDEDAEEEAEEGGTNDVPNADFVADAAAVQRAVTTTVAVASTSAASSLFGTMSSSSHPATSTLSDILTPVNNMDVDSSSSPLIIVTANNASTTSAASVPTPNIPSNITGNKRKKRMPLQLAPSIDSQHLNSNNSVTCLDQPLSSAHSKRQWSAAPSWQTSSSTHSQQSSCNDSETRWPPSQRKGIMLNIMSELKEAINHMSDIMETSNLVMSAPVKVAATTDEVLQAHQHVLATIKQDASFTIEEKGCIISYIIINPTATLSYDHIHNDDIWRAWLHNAALGE